MKVCIALYEQGSDIWIEGPGTLFRMDSMASKIMRFYCKLVGHQYLTSVLWPQIRAVLLSDEFIEVCCALTMVK